MPSKASHWLLLAGVVIVTMSIVSRVPALNNIVFPQG